MYVYYDFSFHWKAKIASGRTLFLSLSVLALRMLLLGSILFLGIVAMWLVSVSIHLFHFL